MENIITKLFRIHYQYQKGVYPNIHANLRFFFNPQMKYQGIRSKIVKKRDFLGFHHNLYPERLDI